MNRDDARAPLVAGGPVSPRADSAGQQTASPPPRIPSRRSAPARPAASPPFGARSPSRRHPASSRSKWKSSRRMRPRRTPHGLEHAVPVIPGRDRAGRSVLPAGRRSRISSARFQRAQQPQGLGARFGELLGRTRIRHDAGARPEPDLRDGPSASPPRPGSSTCAVSVRIKMLRSPLPSRFRYPSEPVYAPRPPPSSSAMISMQRTLGHPVIVPPGKQRANPPGSGTGRPAAGRSRSTRCDARGRRFRSAMYSSTRTVPPTQTRPRSLRSRSISMTCSARSFSSLEQRFDQGLVGHGRCAARPRPGNGPGGTRCPRGSTAAFPATSSSRKKP